MTDPMNGRWMTRRTREYTRKIYDMMEEGVLDPLGVAQSLLNWMSEDDVKEFYERYGLDDGESDE